ncbi:MAG: carboxypeptidase regulatory-like domain-containing protein [Planctomycetes bacterium]|nr:carboxypeptidase regulatory-like domain-containing protein [Planctomycetota bacterium]
MRTALAILLVLAAALVAWVQLAGPGGSGALELEPGTARPARPADSVDSTAPAHTLAADADDSPVQAPRAARSVAAPASAEVVAARPVAATLVVRVTALETGAPLGRVPVRAQLRTSSEASARWPGGSSPWSGLTDEDGRVELSVPQGAELEAVVESDRRRRGGARASVPALATGERREVGLEIATAEDLVAHGVVLRSDTREPIAGVLVAAVPSVALDEGPSTQSANDGSFRLPLRSYATQGLSYSHPQHGSASSGVGDARDGSAPLVVLLDAGASLQLAVTDLAGRPTDWWTAVAVTLAPPGSSRGAGGAPASCTITAGCAVLRGLVAGEPLLLEVRRGEQVAWRARSPLVLAPGEQRTLAIRIGGAALAGRVTHADGRAAAHAVLGARPVVHEPLELPAPDVLAQCDAAGAYRFEGLEPGPWLVGVTERTSRLGVGRQRLGNLLQLEPVELLAGANELDLVLVERAISGRVVDAAGLVVPNATVHGRSATHDAQASTAAGADGAFELRTPLAGDWILEARVHPAGGSAPITARSGAAGLVLAIEPCAALTVEALDERGAPVSGVRVSLLGDAGVGPALAWSPSETPAASLDCLRAGRFHVLAEAGGLYGLQRDVRIEPGRAQRLEVVLRPAGRARIRFEGPGDAAEVELLDAGVAVRRALVLRGLPLELTGPAGAVELRLYAAGTEEAWRGALRADGSTELVFDGTWR